MDSRRLKELFGTAVAGAMTAAGVGGASAQTDDGSGEDFFSSLGDSIRTSVLDAVSPISTSDDATTEEEGSSLALDDSSGLVEADASGGNTNVAFVS